jgi:hypothetical protein
MDADLDDLDSPSKRTRSESPTTLRRPGPISSTSRFAPHTANLTSPTAALRTLPGLSNGGAKAMKDSLGEMKCLTSSLQKSLARVENDLVPSILEDVKSLESQLESLEDVVKDRKEENGSMMGTLQAQDEYLTILERMKREGERARLSERKMEKLAQYHPVQTYTHDARSPPARRSDLLYPTHPHQQNIYYLRDRCVCLVRNQTRAQGQTRA